MAKKKNQQPSISFDDNGFQWPEHSQFPLNINDNKNVEKILIEDIKVSSSYTIVTGFTSLSHLVIFFGERINTAHINNIRIVLGWSPDERWRRDFSLRIQLDKEVKEYWLKRGFSILEHAGAVINLIELIDKKKIHFKASNANRNHLHAKIYVGEKHVIMGSSNFSQNGLTKQHEANIRLENNSQNNFEKKLYFGACQIAENFFANGKDFNDEIKELLEKTLKVTSWQESLARAIQEMLNRDWTDDFSELKGLIESARLWPIQKMVIGWAFSILQEQGCVLIATPTGSGKTKLISVLQLLLIKWLSDIIGVHKAKSQVICPPIVVGKWNNEKAAIMSSNDSISIGILSAENSRNYKTIVQQIESANLLVVDEVHNFLRHNAKRTQTLSKNTADNVIISTATPISRKPQDLLRLVEILGIDNLDEPLLREYKSLTLKGGLKRIEDYFNLKQFISKFIVRRTKSEINDLIDKEPNSYKNTNHQLCRYPKKIYDTYNTEESDIDKKLADEINSIISDKDIGLKGIVYLQNFNKPEFPLDISIHQHINNRISAARFLSCYVIQSSLRSSRPALIERIQGTQASKEYFNFRSSKQEIGDIIGTIKSLINKKKLPSKYYSDSYFPDWLNDESKYIKACEEEIAIYERIVSITKKMSNQRELGKANFLSALFDRHKLVVAFDDTIITLDYIRYLISQNHPHIEVYVGTGDTDITPILNKFRLGSEAKNILALCSRNMSEGIDLQQSDALVMLDIPSVLRYAEQRIGRIDRLDSPHESIKIFFPNDSLPFSLRTDLKLYKILEESRYLIGNNFQLPEQLIQKFEGNVKTVNANDLINIVRSREDDNYGWEEFSDAFKVIYDLYKGSNPLISETIYEEFKGIDVEVKVKVSVEISKSRWAFIAVKGTKYNPPKWFFIDSDRKPISNLKSICDKLHEKLKGGPVSEGKWDMKVDQELKEYGKILRRNEMDLLPRRRKKSLELAKFILNDMFKKSNSYTEKKILTEVLDLFKPSQQELVVNFYLFSQQWLDIFNSHLHTLRKERRRRSVIVNLDTIRSDYAPIEKILTLQRLEDIRDNVPLTESIWKHIAACIIGIEEGDLD